MNLSELVVGNLYTSDMLLSACNETKFGDYIRNDSPIGNFLLLGIEHVKQSTPNRVSKIVLTFYSFELQRTISFWHTNLTFFCKKTKPLI